MATASLTKSPAWKALQEHHQAIAQRRMRDLFAEDDSRFANLSLSFGDILLDFSKNRVTTDTLMLLRDLARHADLSGWIEKMYSGEKINFTEGRSVLHIALRNRSHRAIVVDGEDVMPKVNAVLAHMREFTTSVRSGEWKGYTGKAITDIVNIGIGGSDLGPLMVTEALKPYCDGPKAHYVSN